VVDSPIELADATDVLAELGVPRVEADETPSEVLDVAMVELNPPNVDLDEAAMELVAAVEVRVCVVGTDPIAELVRPALTV
jgi:hypothetical protein